MDNIDELFEENSNLPAIIKYIIYQVKRILCILTIKEEKLCIWPYKKVKNKFIINLIIKALHKTTKSVVLSNSLNEFDYINEKLIQNKMYIYTGKVLGNYLLYEFIGYISKMKHEEMYKQELFILINNPSKIDESNIIYFSKNFKRINIVTNQINHFRKIENYLEDKLGIAITITNNKRKSLLKAKIIINLDFDEETINNFNINRNAIILNPNNKVNIKSKLFNGINIHDYQIIYKNKFNSLIYKKFDKRLLYESTIIGKKYDEVIKQIKEDDVRIVNLLGKNGVINQKEYTLQ